MMSNWFQRQAQRIIPLVACFALARSCCLALEPELDTSSPLPDGTFSHTQPQDSDSLPPLQGMAQKKQPAPPPTASSTKPAVLTGKVQTLQQAMDNERNLVNWYTWYLSARAYLGATGGIQCPLGTPIKFYKNGRIEPLSYDFTCISSLLGKHFPLPEASRLEAVILPVRPGNGPPASPEELYSRIRDN